MQEAVHTYPDLGSARAALIEACVQAQAAGKRPVVLVESSARALQERRMFAAAGAGFGVQITTLANWVSSLWPLHGDARNLVGEYERLALMSGLLRVHSGSLPLTPGMVLLLCRAAQEALIYSKQSAKLIGNEEGFVEILKTYATELEKRGSLEYCEALSFLASAPAVQAYAPVVFDMDLGSYGAAETAFLKNTSAQVIEAELRVYQEAPEGQNLELAQFGHMLFSRGKDQAAVQATGAVVCALAAGPSAEHKLIADCIQDALVKNPQAYIVVAAKDPLAEFEYCAQKLASQGVQAALQTSIRFGETDAGRALINLAHLTENSNGYFDKLESTDFSFSPFSGIWYGEAFNFDKYNRLDRGKEAGEILTDLAMRMPDELHGTISLFEEGDYAAAIDHFEQYIKKAFAAKPNYVAQQLRALALAREAFSAAAEQETPASLLLECLANHGIAYSVGTLEGQGLAEGPAGDGAAHAQVLFTTLFSAANLAPANVDCLVVGGLTVASYPVKAEFDALYTLLSKWGKEHQADSLLRLRRAFQRAVLAARECVYLQRALNDEKADPVQASVLFEEAMDCYRETLEDFSDVDENLLIPNSLVPYSKHLNETTFVENLVGEPYANSQEASLPPLGHVATNARELLVLKRDYKGKTYPGTDLSASQIESYLECPYQWFAKRRLNLESLDEGFGPMERGTFIHSVLDKFYRQFQAEVAPKVTLENMDSALAVFEQVYENEVKRNKDELHWGERYKPITATEEQLVEDLRIQLRQSLVHEAHFLPHFEPRYLEFEYGMPVPFSYAGCNIYGRIDRIDVDSAGNAIVVDYKSSLSNEYRLLAKENPKGFELPHKVQTLIYAQAARKELGLNIVGALYFNVLSGAVQGAFSKDVVGPADFPLHKEGEVKFNGVPCTEIESFEQLLDTTEALVQERIEALLAGEIAPDPICEDVCRYCPVAVCNKRAKDRVD